jgi:hypothetical protein
LRVACRTPDVHQRTTAALHLVADIVRIHIVVAEEASNGTECPDAAFGKQFPKTKPLRIAPDHKGLADLHAGAGPHRKQRLGLGDRKAERFLAENVFAGLCGLYRPGDMELVGKGIVDGIDAWIGQKLLVRAVSRGDVERGCRIARFGEITGSNCVDARVLALLHGRKDFFETDGGGAENSPAKLFTHAGMINRDPAGDVLRISSTERSDRTRRSSRQTDLIGISSCNHALCHETDGIHVCTNLRQQLRQISGIPARKSKRRGQSSIWTKRVGPFQPAERMKMDTPHIVPLSRQAVEVLRALKLLTGNGRLVFPGAKDKKKPMSNNTILYALYRLGYRDRMTGHGFRGLASTILHENGFDEAHIELQLAHMKRNKVAAAYNHAKYLKQRTDMMQWWADYLDAQLVKGRRALAV